MSAQKLATRLVRDHFGPAQSVVEAASTTHPDFLTRTAVSGGIGAAVGAIGGVIAGSVGGAVAGLNLGAVIGCAVGEEPGMEVDLIATSMSNLQNSQKSLLVVTTSHLMAWGEKGKDLIAYIPLPLVTSLWTEPSRSGPTHGIVAIEVAGVTARLDVPRPKLGRFLGALERQLGSTAEKRRRDEPSLWLLRAFVVATLYFLGISSLLAAPTTIESKSAAYAIVTALIGLTLTAAGEMARRVLLPRDRR